MTPCERDDRELPRREPAVAFVSSRRIGVVGAGRALLILAHHTEIVHPCARVERAGYVPRLEHLGVLLPGVQQPRIAGVIGRQHRKRLREKSNLPAAGTRLSVEDESVGLPSVRVGRIHVRPRKPEEHLFEVEPAASDEPRHVIHRRLMRLVRVVGNRAGPERRFRPRPTAPRPDRRVILVAERLVLHAVAVQRLVAVIDPPTARRVAIHDDGAICTRVGAARQPYRSPIRNQTDERAEPSSAHVARHAAAPIAGVERLRNGRLGLRERRFGRREAVVRHHLRRHEIVGVVARFDLRVDSGPVGEVLERGRLVVDQHAARVRVDRYELREAGGAPDRQRPGARVVARNLQQHAVLDPRQDLDVATLVEPHVEPD